jgi:hypothetical protein
MPFSLNERVIRVSGPPEFHRTTLNQAGVIYHIENHSSTLPIMPRIYCVRFDNGHLECATEDQLQLETAIRVAPRIFVARATPPVAPSDDFYIDDTNLPYEIKGGEHVIVDGLRRGIIYRRNAGNNYTVKYEDGSYDQNVNESRITRGVLPRGTRNRETRNREPTIVSRGPYAGQRVKINDQPGVIERISGDYVYVKSDITGQINSVNVNSPYLLLL